MFEELPVYSDISSAYFDAENKTLYYADYSRIYVCDTNKLNNLTEDQHFENVEVFSVAQSYVNILPVQYHYWCLKSDTIWYLCIK